MQTDFRETFNRGPNVPTKTGSGSVPIEKKAQDLRLFIAGSGSKHFHGRIRIRSSGCISLDLISGGHRAPNIFINPKNDEEATALRLINIYVDI